MFKLITPIAFIIFNRPDTTQRVFEEIRKATPKELFIIADGPRVNNSEDDGLCKKTREIVEKVDWDCKVHKNFSEINLGTRIRPASGLEWVFSKTDDAIILEDDCLPHPSFFEYCQNLLEHYRNSNNVNMISGSNFISRNSNKSYSYYFSVFHHFWGWATWKRSWELFDLEMKAWPELKESKLLYQIVPDKKSAKYWETLLDEVYNGKISTSWDYQWYYSSWKNKNLAIIPSVNLISNIGFGKEATHTKNTNHIRANVPLEDIQFPLIHPHGIISDVKVDMIEAKKIFKFNGKERIIRFIKKIIQQNK
jgi:hypothetical protein